MNTKIYVIRYTVTPDLIGALDLKPHRSTTSCPVGSANLVVLSHLETPLTGSGQVTKVMTFGCSSKGVCTFPPPVNIPTWHRDVDRGPIPGNDIRVSVEFYCIPFKPMFYWLSVIIQDFTPVISTFNL